MISNESDDTLIKELEKRGYRVKKLGSKSKVILEFLDDCTPFELDMDGYRISRGHIHEYKNNQGEPKIYPNGQWLIQAWQGCDNPESFEIKTIKNVS